MQAYSNCIATVRELVHQHDSIAGMSEYMCDRYATTSVYGGSDAVSIQCLHLQSLIWCQDVKKTLDITDLQMHTQFPHL